MEYAIFLGCTVPIRARQYEMSARRVAEELQLPLHDVEGFDCCGFPVRSVSRAASLLFAARSLALAEEAGYHITTLCTACGGILSEANKELKEHPSLLEQVNDQLVQAGMKQGYQGGVEVKHFARLLVEEVGLEKIRQAIRQPLHLRVVPHYGCHYLKPNDAFQHFDDPEQPSTLEQLLEACGATVVDFAGRDRCCGGALLAVDEDVALRMARVKLESAHENKADCLALLCAFCSVMYDTNQAKIAESTEHEPYNLPVFYYPQLLGLAMGLSPKELGCNMNRVKTKPLLARLEL